MSDQRVQTKDELSEIMRKRVTDLEAENARLENENARLKDELTHFAIQRDMEFWRNYADNSCKELLNSNAKLAAAHGEVLKENQRLEKRE